MISTDWLNSLSKSVSARIEGRNTVIVFVLLFCAFALWSLLSGFESHRILSWVFIAALFVIVGFIAVAGLLLTPQPSEITAKYLIQQHGKDLLVAGGLQSHEAVIELLRVAHNIQDLPPPVGIVKGSAANSSEHTGISPSEASELVDRDHRGIIKLLKEEASAIQSSLVDKSGLAGGIQREVHPTPKEEGPLERNRVPKDTP